MMYICGYIPQLGWNCWQLPNNFTVPIPYIVLCYAIKWYDHFRYARDVGHLNSCRALDRIRHVRPWSNRKVLMLGVPFGNDSHIHRTNDHFCFGEDPLEMVHSFQPANCGCLPESSMWIHCETCHCEEKALQSFSTGSWVTSLSWLIRPSK